jgi:thiol:disulfide interchange protein
MVKLTNRYRGMVFALIMSCCTACVVSGVIIYLHSQSFALFLRAWAGGFFTAWPIVFISILTIAPLVNRFLNKFFDEI